jgi:hypothetical protein
MIEPAWPLMKRGISHQPGFEIKEQLDPIFTLLWKELPQEMIRRWIERIPGYI